VVELTKLRDGKAITLEEIKEVEAGKADKVDNPLKNAPHTAKLLMAETWSGLYSRQQAYFPITTERDDKYWPPVGRIDNLYGDKNLFCSCMPVQSYED